MGRLLKEMMVIGLGGLAALYLVFPTLGLFELIPDAIPLIGSMDEAGATLILLNAFRYYGVDLQRLFGKRSDSPPQLPDQQR